MTDSILICPSCREPLAPSDRMYRCANGHCFDLAKEGYLNLLLSHQRRSADPGDGKAMIQARRRFFDSGAYAPLIELIREIIPDGTVLDAGCGEGALSGSLPGTVFGTDISKEAVRAAAKRYKPGTWVVANTMRELPFADQSFDTILSVLAPRNTDEFARLIKPDGRLILGVPGPNHLIELRSLLNPASSDFEEKADEAAEKCAPLFIEEERAPLTFQARLNREQISDLIQMTPIFWNSSPEAKEKAAQLNELSITASFVLQRFKRSDH